MSDRSDRQPFRKISQLPALYDSDWIERQLSHIEGNKIKAAYNYAQHLDDRRRMMQWYADYLDSLRDGTSEPVRS